LAGQEGWPRGLQANDRNKKAFAPIQDLFARPKFRQRSAITEAKAFFTARAWLSTVGVRAVKLLQLQLVSDLRHPRTHADFLAGLIVGWPWGLLWGWKRQTCCGLLSRNIPRSREKLQKSPPYSFFGGES
jgi:hypothetical protein